MSGVYSVQPAFSVSFLKHSAAQLRAAVADPRIGQIVFDVDSPGGNAAGATEFAWEVLAARAKKKIIAVANHRMASASYWCMSCATEVIASPSAMVGSIGVYSIHDDVTADANLPLPFWLRDPPSSNYVDAYVCDSTSDVACAGHSD